MAKAELKSERQARGRKFALEILKRLAKEFPEAKIALEYGNNIQLLVAVILSAQCTDKKVNEVTKTLFKKYKTVSDFARADLKTFEGEVRPTGFYRAKTRNIIAAAKAIEAKFGGKLPRTMEEILTLPGVARKTANVVLGNAYGVVEGMAVDTHVKRFAKMCRLSKYDDPNKIEKDLTRLFPKKEWFPATYRIIEHGRDLRFKKNEHAARCPVCRLCPDFLKK